MRRNRNKERDTLISAAVREGKFSRERVQHWSDAYDRNPKGTKRLLARLAPVLAGESARPPKQGAGNLIEPYSPEHEPDAYPASWLGSPMGGPGHVGGDEPGALRTGGNIIMEEV